MKQTLSLRSTVSAFRKNERGNFAIITGVTLPVLMFAVGFGINIVQISSAKARLASALDAALTSTARDITTGTIAIADAKNVALAFLKANGEGGSITAGTVDFSSFTVDKAKSTIDATASAKLDIAFPVFSGGQTRNIATAASTLYSDKQVEVSMMLDITGSMSGQKIKDLKTASKNAVAAFLDGQTPGSERVRVSIVPYAETVNTGPLANVVFNESGSYTGGEPPKLDDPMSVGAGPGDGCATERKGANQFTDASPYAGMINRDKRAVVCPTAKLQPLTTDKAKLNATIDSFSAGGVTAGHIGVQWAWYMLSPQWKTVLPTSAQPGQYNNKKVTKVAILMTDGEFNTAFADVPYSVTNPQGNQGTLSRSKAERLCAEMKKTGIQVFTVGFQLTQAAAKGVMKNCSTADTGKVKHYYEASSGKELNDAFQEIAANIERLTLTK